MNDSVELSSVLKALRKEIAEAARIAEIDDSGVKFALKEVEVELQTVVSAEGSAGCKFNIIVAEAELGGGGSREKTQTLKFKFNVFGENGKIIPISNNDTIDPEGNS